MARRAADQRSARGGRERSWTGSGARFRSGEAKKRELVGDFKAVGREFQLKGKPVEVRGHDFKDKDLGHAIPYGVYDLAADEGWVSVGITSETATFAVNSDASECESRPLPLFPGRLAWDQGSASESSDA